MPEFVGVCHWRREAPFCVADATAWTVVDARRVAVCDEHLAEAVAAGYANGGPVYEIRDASGRFVAASDRVRAARDEALDDALARRAAEVARRAHRRLSPVDTGALRSYGEFELVDRNLTPLGRLSVAPRSIPAPRFRDAAPDVPVLVAAVVLGAAVGLAAFGMARDAVEARVAQYRAARAARKGWPG